MTIRPIDKSYMTAEIVQSKNSELYDLDIQIMSKTETQELANAARPTITCAPMCMPSANHTYCC